MDERDVIEQKFRAQADKMAKSPQPGGAGESQQEVYLGLYKQMLRARDRFPRPGEPILVPPRKRFR